MSSSFSLSLHHHNTLLFILSLAFLVACSTAHDLHDELGNVTIKWDVMQWTADGYCGVVTMYNNQKHRSIGVPEWKMGWTWRRKEVIWTMVGARVTEQGDCSIFHAGERPESCERSPSIEAHCGVVTACRGKDPSNAMPSFQICVGRSGNTNTTVALPSKFTLGMPGARSYTCGPARLVQPTIFIVAGGRRQNQALMTWNLICAYSKFKV